MIKSIKLTNFLSFGNEQDEIELHPLNILIGTNGSGKSNFLEAFDLLHYIPLNIGIPIREGGGVSDWLYKGSDINAPDALLDVVIDNPYLARKHDELHYSVSFNESWLGDKLEITEEQLVSNDIQHGKIEPYYYYHHFNGKEAFVNIQNQYTESDSQYRTIQPEDIDTTQSILAQLRDAFHYPEITFLAQELNKIRLYRDWQFGRYTPPRLRQKADMLNQYLEPDCSNLGLVLNQIEMNPVARNRLLKEL